jgi:hypothetical protein
MKGATIVDAHGNFGLNSKAMLMLCPICAGEFDSPARVCPACGCELFPFTLNPTSEVVTRQEKRRVEFVELCRPRTYPVAMLIKQMLEQNGVAAIVQGGHALSVLPQLVFGGELRVLVDSEEIEYARELYRAYFESDDDTDFIEES